MANYIKQNDNNPVINSNFSNALDDLIEICHKGQSSNSKLFNPEDSFLIDQMKISKKLPLNEYQELLNEANEINTSYEKSKSTNKAAKRAGPDIVAQLETGGLAFFSQLGVARRPDLTQYFIDGFTKNRDAIAFREENQSLFADILPYITKYIKEQFEIKSEIIQVDRQIGDLDDLSFHARMLLCGTDYTGLPYMWKQLTFPLSKTKKISKPNIVELSIPKWLENIKLPQSLKDRIKDANLTQLILKAPTRGLSLHLGFDYMGEHKMGPLSIAMFLVKQQSGLAVQAALSMTRMKNLHGINKNSALITIGPSLHGKSTLTIMIELKNSELAKILNLTTDLDEGTYPMNDDIVLIQKLNKPISQPDKDISINYSINGTENSFYAVPFGLNIQDDPITYEVLRGTVDTPNPNEILENVPIDIDKGTPDFQSNPVRNMRMVLSRQRLLKQKKAENIFSLITNGEEQESIHVPLKHTDQIIWQAVMRQNTIIPPLRRLEIDQYIRILMYGEAVQMGAATGSIGKPYIEYFSDPFIIGLEDDNASYLYQILKNIEKGNLPQFFYVFNTGGVGADNNSEASGSNYKKIPRELTLMLQEALLRDAVKFEFDNILNSDIAVAIIDKNGKEIFNLRDKWIPLNIYGAEEYQKRVNLLKRNRYYGDNSSEKSGILRYTKTDNAILDPNDIPFPINEKELSSLLSFFWSLNYRSSTIEEFDAECSIQKAAKPNPDILAKLQKLYKDSCKSGIKLSEKNKSILENHLI